MTSIPISSGPGLCWNGRDVTGEKSVGDDDMNSKGAASGAKTEARRALRVGVIGAGVMGSNHARVLAGPPPAPLVPPVRPPPGPPPPPPPPPRRPALPTPRHPPHRG